MHMHVIRDVKAGEELLVDYIDLLQSRKSRLKELEVSLECHFLVVFVVYFYVVPPALSFATGFCCWKELRFFTCLCSRCDEQRVESLWHDPLMAPVDVRVDAQLDAAHCESCGKTPQTCSDHQNAKKNTS